MLLRRVLPSAALLGRRLLHQSTQQPDLIRSADPYRLPLGHLKLAFATLGSLYIGGKIAQAGVYLMEVYEIYVQKEDDDDDDD